MPPMKIRSKEKTEKKKRRRERELTHLVHPDLAVRDQAHHQHVPQGLGLPERVGVAVVHHVEAAVHVHPHGCARAPAAGMPREGAGEEGGDGPGAVVVLFFGFRFVFWGAWKRRREGGKGAGGG